MLPCYRTAPVVVFVLMLALSVPGSASAYEDYPYGQGSSNPYDSYDQGTPAPTANRTYENSQQSSYTSAPQAQAGYGVPFGMSKSTAGAIAGAILGAGSGAIVGSHRGRAGRGALIGGGIGALGGYMAGRQLENRDVLLDEQDRLIEQQRQEIARNRALLEELKRHHLDARETERGVVVNLPDVLFQYDKSTLTSTAQEKVSYIAKVVNQRAKTRRIAVEGHADAIGSDSYNLTLSKRRAESVARELTYNHVGNNRLITRGYGEKYPVAPNINPDGSDNPAGRAKNRRVEVVIEN